MNASDENSVYTACTVQHRSMLRTGIFTAILTVKRLELKDVCPKTQIVFRKGMEFFWVSLTTKWLPIFVSRKESGITPTTAANVNSIFRYIFIFGIILGLAVLQALKLFSVGSLWIETIVQMTRIWTLDGDWSRAPTSLQNTGSHHIADLEGAQRKVARMIKALENLSREYRWKRLGMLM